MNSSNGGRSGGDEQAVLAVFQEAARQVDGSGRIVLAKDTQISELGLDSVAVMELVAQVEQQLGVRIPDEQLTSATSIGGLVDAVRRLLP
jgi:acyl carrier protein